MKNKIGVQRVCSEMVPVSVVIPCFKSSDVICRALDSVYEQTLSPQEVIVVDDYSNDGTLQLLESLVCEYGAGWLKVIASPENGGPGTARNLGWDAAKGEYVAFLDADDAWHPRKLEIQYSWMSKHRNVSISGHPCKVTTCQDESIKPEMVETTFSPVNRFSLLAKNHFPTPTIMVRRNISTRFSEGKRHSEEYLLACELFFDGKQCAVSPLPLTYIFKEPYGDGGLSGNIWKMEKGELNVYSTLFVEGRINLVERIFFSLFSLIKFLRRILLVSIRKLFR
ncbi:glycosyltransferase family 2 protein [Marinobacter lipolyticus]|uniref:glycosyltransferase family 2 protein n=1 Tax=Marinobacter lipolyticus TaxID=209639 RepID=UPI003A9432C0